MQDCINFDMIKEKSWVIIAPTFRYGYYVHTLL